jgi:hypothetical protein
VQASANKAYEVARQASIAAMSMKEGTANGTGAAMSIKSIKKGGHICLRHAPWLRACLAPRHTRSPSPNSLLQPLWDWWRKG